MSKTLKGTVYLEFASIYLDDPYIKDHLVQLPEHFRVNQKLKHNKYSGKKYIIFPLARAAPGDSMEYHLPCC